MHADRDAHWSLHHGANFVAGGGVCYGALCSSLRCGGVPRQASRSWYDATPSTVLHVCVVCHSVTVVVGRWRAGFLVARLLGPQESRPTAAMVVTELAPYMPAFTADVAMRVPGATPPATAAAPRPALATSMPSLPSAGVCTSPSSLSLQSPSSLLWRCCVTADFSAAPRGHPGAPAPYTPAPAGYYYTPGGSAPPAAGPPMYYAAAPGGMAPGMPGHGGPAYGTPAPYHGAPGAPPAYLTAPGPAPEYAAALYGGPGSTSPYGTAGSSPYTGMPAGAYGAAPQHSPPAASGYGGAGTPPAYMVAQGIPVAPPAPQPAPARPAAYDPYAPPPGGPRR